MIEYANPMALTTSPEMVNALSEFRQSINLQLTRNDKDVRLLHLS